MGVEFSSVLRCRNYVNIWFNCDHIIIRRGLIITSYFRGNFVQLGPWRQDWLFDPFKCDVIFCMYIKPRNNIILSWRARERNHHGQYMNMIIINIIIIYCELKFLPSWRLLILTRLFLFRVESVALFIFLSTENTRIGVRLTPQRVRKCQITTRSGITRKTVFRDCLSSVVGEAPQCSSATGTNDTLVRSQ